MNAVLKHHRSQMADDLGRCHKFLGMFRKFPKRDELSCELQHCSDIFISSKVKVAVIDNGVDQMHFALSQSIDVERHLCVLEALQRSQSSRGTQLLIHMELTWHT